MVQPSETHQLTDGSDEGIIIGNADGKVGFYGLTPIVQRPYTSSVHLSSELATSTTFSEAHLDALNECQKTFVSLGIWATV